MEISMLPIHALSMRARATIFPPSSATAMFIGWPISLAFASAALIMRRASSNFTAVMGYPLMSYALAQDVGGTGLADRVSGITPADRFTFPAQNPIEQNAAQVLTLVPIFISASEVLRGGTQNNFVDFHFSGLFNGVLHGASNRIGRDGDLLV